MSVKTKKELGVHKAWNTLLALDSINPNSHDDVSILYSREHKSWYVKVDSISWRNIHNSAYNYFREYANSPDKAVIAAYESAINPYSGWVLELRTYPGNPNVQITWEGDRWAYRNE